jgi:DNA-binding NarL/FixJ family response regulator
LSAREVQVLEGIVRGERDREMAARLGIAEKTVKKYTAMVRKKLGVRSRTEAAMQAVALGIVVPSVHAS